jgi:formyltetrahydrofolate-dependent phosphoribosylglycinamide formyltransferase
MSSRLVVMISGSGTNLQTLINAQRILDTEIVLVVSNRKDAYGLKRAEAAGIPALYFPVKAFTGDGKTRADYDAALAEKVKTFQPDLIALAGWMHILSPAFLDHFPNRVINLHPALPGEFSGTDAIQRAYEAYTAGKINRSGCMVHYVVPEVDAGPVIAQAVVSFFDGDTLEAFETRMHAAEHQLIVQAVGVALEKQVNR